MLDTKDRLEFKGVYNTLYNATTRPDFKFAVTRYFIDEWVPLLGPSLSWLIVGLRQQCYWNRRRNWCIVDKSTLADETALNKRTIERVLKKPLSRWFVLDITHRYKYRHRLGKRVRDKNRYQLLLDEPLSPRHQLGLGHLLRQMAPNGPDPLDAALTAVQSVLEIARLTDKISFTGQIPADLKRQSILELVTETLGVDLNAVSNDERLVHLDQRCAKLHTSIVQPNKVYVGWQYFRLKWVPLLGHALAWLVIYLRRHCYWDEASGELRDTHTAYKKALAKAIGQTTRNLANLTENPHAPLFFTVLNPDASRNKPTTFQTRMVDEPLTPDDQQRLADELHRRLEGDIYGLDPESGQLNLFPILGQLPKRQIFAYGYVPENLPLRDTKKGRSDATTSEILSRHDPHVTGKNVATTNNTFLIPSPLEKLQKQQNQVAVQTNGLTTLLDDLMIQEPTRSRLLGNPDLTIATVGAWYLYAETQPGLFDPRSYVIKRLLSNDPPPTEFLAFARLTDAEWQLFEATAQALQAGQPLNTDLPDHLETVFINWVAFYGNMDSEEARRRLTVAKHVEITDGVVEDYAGASLQGEGTALWQAVLDELQLQMARDTFNTWLLPTRVHAYQDGKLTIMTESRFAVDWLQNRLIESIKRTLRQVAGSPVAVTFLSPTQE